MRIGNLLLIVFLFLSFSNPCSAQIKAESKKGKNLNKGLFFGYGISKYRIKESNWSQTTYRDSLDKVNSPNKNAQSIGFLLGYPLSSITSIRIKLGLDFIYNEVHFYRPNQLDKIKLPEIAFISPIHILISTPLQPIKPYFFTGGTFRFSLGKVDSIEGKIPTRKFDIAGDLGIGIVFKTRSFAITPELFISKGFLNLKKPRNNLYGNVVESYKKQIVFFQLIVENLK